MRLGPLTVGIGNAQHIGARSEQQDYFGIGLWPEPTEADSTLEHVWLVLSDGMGGHAGGADASVVAVDSFLREVRGALPPKLRESMEKANQDVCALGAGTDMGATLCGLQVHPDGLRWTSVGDSLIYRYRQSELTRLNRDHNVGENIKEALATGQPLPEHGGRPGERAMLTSYLGLPHLPQIDVAADQGVRAGDTFVLCSDGLTDALSHDEISGVLAASTSAEDIAHRLVDAAIGKGRPRQDNTTVLVLRLGAPARGAKRPVALFALLATMAFLMFAGLTVWWLSADRAVTPRLEIETTEPGPQLVQPRPPPGVGLPASKDPPDRSAPDEASPAGARPAPPRATPVLGSDGAPDAASPLELTPGFEPPVGPTEQPAAPEEEPAAEREDPAAGETEGSPEHAGSEDASSPSEQSTEPPEAPPAEAETPAGAAPDDAEAPTNAEPPADAESPADAEGPAGDSLEAEAPADAEPLPEQASPEDRRKARQRGKRRRKAGPEQ